MECVLSSINADFVEPVGVEKLKVFFKSRIANNERSHLAVEAGIW
jgi:hypothetical protein